MLEYKQKRNNGRTPFASLCVCVDEFLSCVQDISKSYLRIRIKYPEYVEIATQTNWVDFDEDPISEKRPYLTLTLSPISELISRADMGRTNNLSTHNLMFSMSFKNRWWLTVLDVRLSRLFRTIMSANRFEPNMSADPLCPAHYVRGPNMSGPLCPRANNVRPIMSTG